MGKHARKKQKTSAKPCAGPMEPSPLGTTPLLGADDEKDDEERRLEALLFGVPYVPSSDGKGKEKNILVISDDEDEDEDEDGDGGEGARELEHMLDEDLFFIDDGAPKAPPIAEEQDDDEDASDLEASASGSHRSVSGASDAPSRVDSPPSATTTPPPANESLQRSRKSNPPAWTDPSDADLTISLASSARLRKLRDAPGDDVLGGREYERRLRRQYERINPEPAWVGAARKNKRRRTDEDEEGVDELLTSTCGVVGGEKEKGRLEAGVLGIERLRDANQAAVSEGAVRSVQFHPSRGVPVLMVASADRRVRLFNVDGLTNPPLQTLHVPSLPLTHASFHPAGTSVLLTGPRPFFYTYDLQRGTAQKSARGLWGTSFTSAHNTAPPNIEMTAFSPDGAFLAAAGPRGAVHLLDWARAPGSGQVVGSVKLNAGVRALRWTSGGEVMALGADAGVYVFDVRCMGAGGEGRCVRRWEDAGGFGSVALGGDKGGRWLAVGSNTGLVNVYGADATGTQGTPKPRPLKTLGQLTTGISTLAFNHDAQLLAVASGVKKDAMRMIHLPSLTAFANWPTSSTPLGHVTSVDFSAGSEYVAIGNTRGRVLLYHLRAFGVH